MKYKYAIFIYLISVFLNPTLSSEKVSENKISIELNDIFLLGRDITQINDFRKVQNLNYYFKRYNENNSFLEISLRELTNEKHYFSLTDKLDLISKPQFEKMDRLNEVNVTDILTFFDIKNNKYFYYRLFDNKNFDNEKCLIFVSGTKKNNNNFYSQIVNGVGCSTEFDFKNNLITKILSSIKINNLDQEINYKLMNKRFNYDDINKFKTSLLNFGQSQGSQYNEEIINNIELLSDTSSLRSIIMNNEYEEFITNNPTKIYAIILEASKMQNIDEITFIATQSFLRQISKIQR
ncbi:hypothetical protein N8251_00665 [Alphaproteobacteria bacterium]|nr:hypothetical protein [Alphaproteobacteria bacterium]